MVEHKDNDLTSFFAHDDDQSQEPPAPSVHRYIRHNLNLYSEKKELVVEVVGQHPLWGHYLWNAGIALARHFEEHSGCVEGKQVIELGAGAGLPSIVSVFMGAKLVCLCLAF
jgi:EEF1A N-terminal glycine/lysine methyltransferase